MYGWKMISDKNQAELQVLVFYSPMDSSVDRHVVRRLSER